MLLSGLSEWSSYTCKLSALKPSACRRDRSSSKRSRRGRARTSGRGWAPRLGSIAERRHPQREPSTGREMQSVWGRGNRPQAAPGPRSEHWPQRVPGTSGKSPRRKNRPPRYPLWSTSWGAPSRPHAFSFAACPQGSPAGSDDGAAYAALPERRGRRAREALPLAGRPVRGYGRTARATRLLDRVPAAADRPRRTL